MGKLGARYLNTTSGEKGFPGVPAGEAKRPDFQVGLDIKLLQNEQESETFPPKKSDCSTVN